MRALSRWVGAFAGGLPLLFCTGGVAVEVPQARDFGVPGTNASHWPRWLQEDTGRSDRTTPATAASTPLTMAAGDSLRQRFSTDAVVQK